MVATADLFFFSFFPGTPRTALISFKRCKPFENDFFRSSTSAPIIFWVFYSCSFHTRVRCQLTALTGFFLGRALLDMGFFLSPSAEPGKEREEEGDDLLLLGVCTPPSFKEMTSE